MAAHSFEDVIAIYGSNCFTVTKNFLKELKIEFDYFEFLKGTQKGTQMI